METTAAAKRHLAFNGKQVYRSMPHVYMEMEHDDVPPISALFTVVFDQKVGYTLAWKRCLGDLDLDGVEYKCLPSGLHSVQEDLVYFVHGSYAGVSAFVQAGADASRRNANFVAVGALVPLTEGRLGRAWLLAPELRRLAADTVKDAEDKTDLEAFWEEHRQDEKHARKEPTSTSMARRSPTPRGLDRSHKPARLDTSTSGLHSNAALPLDHPATSVPILLDTFGPLIFPLYRAALLRKRVLILGAAPVQQACNYVYMFSLLSSIPQSLVELVQPDSEALVRIQTLFQVGIHDMPLLSDSTRQSGWLACTTDDILGEKKDLYDILVRLPPATSPKKKWPQITTSDGTPLKATQRDLRRYRLLRSELRRSTASRPSSASHMSYRDADTSPLLRASSTTLLNEVKPASPDESETSVVEPTSWTAMVYNGFMWWASAGEMEAWEAEEARSDRELFDDMPDMSDMMTAPRSDDSAEDTTTATSAQAAIVTAYFHRLTSALLQPLSSLVEDADDETEEGVADSAIEISMDDVRAMGLDTWSPADQDFVKEAMELYFGREARLEEGGTRICGVRMC